MAGFREFVTGEVLTASNVDDFLAKQVVQKYADAAARDAALGTAVAGGNALREGMVAYLDDTDDVLKYDGSAWTTVGNAGIGSNVVLGTTTTTTTTTSTLFVDTSLSGTITPTSATSKILVFVQTQQLTQNNNAGSSVFTVYRGNASTGTELAAQNSLYFGTSSSGIVVPGFLLVVDSPASTSATTYTFAIRSTNASNTATAGARQNIVLVEVAA